MTSTLHITNGDAVIPQMQQAGLPGDILPWRDILHEGPVPAGLSLDALSQVRADYIASEGYGEQAEIRQSFAERDSQLKHATNDRDTQIRLWFEHDLYDQLQLLQVLDWFAENPPASGKLSLICTDNYLGRCSPEKLAALQQFEQPVTKQQLKLAQTAWAAFRKDSPESWFSLLSQDTSALPFLHGAVLRMLEEYPSRHNGLSRTAHTALKIIAEGESKPGKVFAAYIQTEQREFLGDWSFFALLRQMLNSTPALLELPSGQQLTLPPKPEQRLTVTQAGQQVLTGETSWLALQPATRWIGGVELSAGHYWRWDSGQQAIISAA